MMMDSVVLKLLEYSTAKLKIEITWDNNQSSLCEIDTFYDTDNGLELDDEGYEEYHVALVKDVLTNNFIEIGLGNKNPILNKIAGTGEVIFKK
ncbi:hypothetical protein [Lysinibacillus sp. 38-6]|uniref:hypothetical protein n=1 Tax=Lysinibacillus sp. 38-6 TaxID=3385991 RepID=UPI0039088A46